MRVAVAFVVLFAVAAAAQNLQPAPAPAAPTPAPAPAAPAAAPAPAAPAPATNTSLPPVIPRMPGYYNPCAAPPCPSTKPMKIATVLGRRGCGCMEQPVCECRPQQFVNPELKPNPADINNAICGCLTEAICPCRPRQLIEAVDVKSFSSNSACGCVGQVSCPCSSGSSSVSYVPAVTSQDSSMGSRVVLTQDACGCLQLAVCPCRKTYVQPELKQSSSPCGCIAEPVCGCRQTAYVAPEVKSSCPCEFQNVDPCACRSSFSSNSGSFGTVKPFYSN